MTFSTARAELFAFFAKKSLRSPRFDYRSRLVRRSPGEDGRKTFERFNVQRLIKKKEIPNPKFQFSNQRNGFRIKSGMTVSVDGTLEPRNAFSLSPCLLVSDPHPLRSLRKDLCALCGLIINRDLSAAALAKTEGKRSNVLTFNPSSRRRKFQILNFNFQINAMDSGSSPE